MRFSWHLHGIMSVLQICSPYKILRGKVSKLSKSSLSSAKFDGYMRVETKNMAYDIAKSSPIKMPTIILVNPFLDANVGSVSRAMLNFGLTELRIVDPACNITSESAIALSVRSHEILENAKVFSTLKEATSDLQRVYATTVRLRDMNQMIFTPRAAANEIIQLVNAPTRESNYTTDPDHLNSIPTVKSGIVFGRERNGLSNDEVSLADSIITIPTFKHFSSLNLAQAVNIIGYELWTRKIELEDASPPPVWHQPKRSDQLARKDELENFLMRLQSRLDDREYQTEPARRAYSYRGLSALFHRATLASSEVDLLHGVLTALTDPKNKRLVLPALEKTDDEHYLTKHEFLTGADRIDVVSGLKSGTSDCCGNSQDN